MLRAFFQTVTTNPGRQKVKLLYFCESSLGILRLNKISVSAV